MIRTKQNNLRSSSCKPAHRAGEAEAFSDELCCVRILVRSVCKTKRNRSTTQETDNQGTGKARTGWTQNLLRLLLHVGGRSCYSDACVEIQQIRVAATALDKKGLTRYGVKFFAGFIQQTGVRRFINKSDGEPNMKALKGAAAKALEGVESIGQESPVGDHQATADIESAVWTPKAQMRATRFGLESRLCRQLAHDDPILTWIPTFADETIARFRKGPDGKTPWESKPESGPEIHWSLVSASS